MPMLWKKWWELVCQLKGACARTRTFSWMIVCLMEMTVRTDLMGVSSIGRALGLVPTCHDRILDFFHSPALCLDKLTRLWRRLVFQQSGILRVGGHPVLVGDGIKVAKSGKKIRIVSLIHDEGAFLTAASPIYGEKSVPPYAIGLPISSGGPSAFLSASSLSGIPHAVRSYCCPRT
jgi:hypothetical protein